MRDLRDKLIGLLEPELAKLGYELVELEARTGGAGLVRLYIDTPAGVTLDDCAKVSRRVGALLDVEDPMPGSYELEVSSPGLDRPLRTPAHFGASVGGTVKLQTVRAIDGRRRYKGLLRRMEGDALEVEVDGMVHTIPLDMVERAWRLQE